MSESDEIDKILKSYSIDSSTSTSTATIDNDNTVTQSKNEHILTPELLSNSLESITKLMARKSGIKEIEFTKQDSEDFINALKPFEDKLDEILKYLPYAPLIIFSVGYTIRIYGGFKEQKKLKKDNKTKTIEEKRKEYVENIKTESATMTVKEVVSHNAIMEY